MALHIMEADLYILGQVGINKLPLGKCCLGMCDVSGTPDAWTTCAAWLFV